MLTPTANEMKIGQACVSVQLVQKHEFYKLTLDQMALPGRVFSGLFQNVMYIDPGAGSLYQRL